MNLGNPNAKIDVTVVIDHLGDDPRPVSFRYRDQLVRVFDARRGLYELTMTRTTPPEWRLRTIWD